MNTQAVFCPLSGTRCSLLTQTSLSAAAGNAGGVAAVFGSGTRHGALGTSQLEQGGVCPRCHPVGRHLSVHIEKKEQFSFFFFLILNFF